jgi:hypothetical protein
MKIVRLGMTESDLLFLSYVSRYGNLDNETKKRVSKIIMTMVNWLYTTSGYYDKSVKGSYFNFDVTALTLNYSKYIKHLAESVSNCFEARFILHDGFITNLFNMHKDSFLKHYNITNYKSVYGIKFADQIDSVFDLMNGKKILVISSFAGLIKDQYNSGNVYKIYDHFPKVQSVETVKFPYCFFNNGPHNNYFETLDAVFEEIKNIDFDIALLGCGAYGHMLCNLIDGELKKDAVYVGGNIQTIFGILNEREKNVNNPEINEYWITDIPEEYKPPNYKMIENGCYW